MSVHFSWKIIRMIIKTPSETTVAIFVGSDSVTSSSMLMFLSLLFFVKIDDDDNIEVVIIAAASAVDSNGNHCTTQLGCRKKRGGGTF